MVTTPCSALQLCVAATTYAFRVQNVHESGGEVWRGGEVLRILEVCAQDYGLIMWLDFKIIFRLKLGDTPGQA